MHQPAIAIIGAGFSGSILSLRLRSAAPAGTRILLIERSSRLGPGLAYGAAGPTHLLNVPAGRLSPFADQPKDFVHWLQRQPASRVPGLLAAEENFVPRRLYGDYLVELLELSRHEACRTRLELLHEEVVGLDHGARDVTLRFASGGVRTVSVAVLATGHAPPLPPHPTAQALAAAGLWQGDPWQPGALADLDPAAPVLLVGTGLTMVDTALSLLDAGHTGPIHALSRHGLLPCRHLEQATPIAALPGALPDDLSGLLRALRQEIDQALTLGEPWQPVIDALRPFTQELWRTLGAADRRRFLRHLCTYWDVHRHRMPPQVAACIAAAQESGQLRIDAGRIVALDVRGGQAAVSWRRRGADAVDTLRAARVVNCCGPAADLTRSGDKLIRSLLWAGVARPDPLGLGLDVTLEGAVRDQSGAASRRLYAIGPLTRGTWWEITAVPDIRLQCETMARALGSRLASLGAGALPRADPLAPPRAEWRRMPLPGR